MHNQAAPVSFGLSAEDVTRLLEDKSPEVLVGVTEKISGAYGRKTMEEGDNKAAEQIFRLLMRETEIRVRVSLAQNLKNSTTIPKDIVMLMAKDVEEVALPILQFSEVLTEEDLLDLLDNTQSTSRMVAMSKRTHVSDLLSDTLLDKGDDQVAATLVANSGARISEKGLQHIVEAYPSNQQLMETLSTRAHLPLAVAEKLITVVSGALGDSIKKKYHLETDAPIEQEVEKSRESETLKLIRKTDSEEDIDKLINQLISFNRLTPSIILSSLCQGNFGFFETSLARLSSIPVSNARKLITDRGELGFRAIYNKSGLPESLFPAVKTLLKVVRELDAEGEKPGFPRYANRIVERILRHAEDENVDNLSHIIALVRRVA